MNKGRTPFIIAMLAPAVILYGGFFLWPVVQAFVFSLYRWRGVSSEKTFVGFENFRKLTADPVFWKATGNNLWLLVVGGAAIMAISLLVAHGLQGERKSTSLLRGIFLIPQMISLVVVAILWQFIYNPSFGILTSGMRGVGLGQMVVPWLGTGSTALGCLAVVFVWHGVGFYTMLFAAAIRSIPSEIVEAAKLDGASGLRQFFRVTWPMIWSVARVAVIYLCINALNIFALVHLMTQGGPDRRSEVMLTYLYEQAFKVYEFGYATSLAVMNFLIVMLLSGLLMLLFRRDPQASRA
ncbi:MAG: carbohydrate ABC transporter permease [Fimbriimonas sp.]